jgi:hypothetical protein
MTTIKVSEIAPSEPLRLGSVQREARARDADRVWGRRPEVEMPATDARYIIGVWWIDDLTVKDVVFVCHRDHPGRYVGMDRCRTRADLDEWLRHYMYKRWDPEEDGADVVTAIRDLELALVLGQRLQRMRDRALLEKARRWRPTLGEMSPGSPSDVPVIPDDEGVPT